METNYDYFAKHPENVINAIDRFANLTVGELFSKVPPGRKNYWNLITETISIYEEISIESVESMTYKELAAVINGIAGNDKYEDSCNEQLLQYHVLYAMLNGYDIPAVRRFMAIPYECFAEVVRNCSEFSMRVPRDDYAREGRRTIREVLSSIYAGVTKIYNPLSDIAEYGSNVRKGYRGLGRILVTGIAKIYADECSYETVIEKYQMVDEETEYKYEEEEDYEIDMEELYEWV